MLRCSAHANIVHALKVRGIPQADRRERADHPGLDHLHGQFRPVERLLPRFTKETGIAVRVVAVGTGAALNLGRAGDADALLVHACEDEDAFVAAGMARFVAT